jgi:dTDP-glucose 4,6-dehydratase
LRKLKPKILITGGCGFIGHHFVEHIIKNTDWDILVLDKLNYASCGYDRLRDIKVFDDKRVKIFATDFTQEIKDGLLSELGDVDYIVHMGAETHVDNSISNPEPFVINNVLGTMRILELARRLPISRMIYFSTDEVFGAAPEGVAYKEWDRYNSSNPYAATKAGGEELCLAYANTYKVPVFITHTMNVFGERQHPEKFIPSTIRKVLNGEKVIIHSNQDRTKAGSRFYIHARNVASAVLFLLEKGAVRDKYNIVGEREIYNLELALIIAHIVGKTLNYEMVDFHSSRPGHDLRYALDGTKMKDLGWQIPMQVEVSLDRTINWYLAHRSWLGEKILQEVKS